MNRPLHICYLCNEYPPAPRPGGIGVFVQTLARALVAKGHRVTILGLDPEVEELREEWDHGVRVVRLSGRARSLKLGWLINRRRLARYLSTVVAQEGVDVVEAPDFEGMLWLVPKLPVRTVVRIHGGEVYFRRLLGEPLKWKYWWMESRSIRRATAIAAVTQYAWRESRRLFDLPEQPVAILPNPVDCRRFRPAEPGQTVPGRILYSGTFIRKKGVLDLFAALPSVLDQVPGAHLVCVGADAADARTGSPSTRDLAMTMLAPQYHDRVVFTGALPHDRVVDYVRSAQLCVYPSHLETQGIVWVEAMACAKPIVASNTGTGPEVIEDGVTGLLCHPSDHAGLAERMVRALTDECLAARLGAAARERAVSTYSLDVLVPANVAWYRSVLQQ
jgi:glycosyltransferase involved in cell wall biosynthesis